MQGILRSHYKLVENYLNKLLDENALIITCPQHYESILEHKEKLSDIYENYQKALSQMAELIKQFDDHKQSVRKLIILQKKKKKETLKLQVSTTNIQPQQKKIVLAQ
jgi:hypothetical protein